MMSTLPRLKLLFESIAIVTFKILVKIEDVTNDKDLFKILKTILRYLENIASNVTIQKNKWDEVEKLIVNCDNELQKIDDKLTKS